MKFNAQQYFDTATERMRQSRNLYNRGDSYAIAMYVGGVAVECMLRAFKLLRTDDFDERHDLLQLFASSRMLEYTQGSEAVQRMRTSMNEVYNLWANDYRYASEARLKSELTARRVHCGVKGDVLKGCAYRLLNAAEKLTERGAVIWTKLPRK